MNLCLTFTTIDCARSTLLITVKTFCACVYFTATVGKLSYIFIALIEHTIVVNIQYYFLSLDLMPKWLTRDIGCVFGVIPNVKVKWIMLSIHVTYMMSYSCITYGDQTTAIQLLTNNHHATKMQKLYLFLN